MENHRPPRVIIESCIPFVDNRLDGIADVARLAPGEIDAASVADADAIIVRTRTRVNEALLRGSRVSFVATATIGTDHIDLPWCASAGIAVANAPGCNAPAVAQYVLASVMEQGYVPGPDTVIGIVGVGHVGRAVEKWARALGFNVMLCDPPRARGEGGDGFSSLEEIAREADIITFHTPLTREGEDATFHLVSDSFLDACRRHPLIINAARGAVADTQAILRALDRDAIAPPVIDCWEGEPAISAELLARAAIATPHIAGYSLEGKMRATQMALDALCRHFNLPPALPLDADLSVAAAPSAASIAASYSPAADTAILRSCPSDFERLRNTYAYRPEPR